MPGTGPHRYVPYQRPQNQRPQVAPQTARWPPGVEELDGPAASAAAVVRAEKPVVTQPATRTLPPATQQQLSGFSTAPTSSSYATAPTLGKRVPRSAKLILDQLDLSGAVLPHLGRTAAEQQEALSRLQIQQMEGGQHHGMYVASDAVAKLTGKDSRDTGKKVKTMVADGHYQSRTIVPSGHANVSFTKRFCTTSTNCTKGPHGPLVLIFFLVLIFCTWY